MPVVECKPAVTLTRAIRPHTLADFENFLQLASVDDNVDVGPADFQLKYNKNDIRVWSKIVKNDPLKILKLRTTLPFAIENVFDVLCDDGYRLEWDEACIQSEALYKLSDCSTVDYYSMKSPSPLSKRDVTSVRTWQCSPNSICVITSSIVNEKLPVKKGIVRANGKLSGYVLERDSSNKCIFTYVNQFDPCGSIPTILINYFTTRYMPKYIGVLANACKRYPHWKDLSPNPLLKPWIHPHQNVLPQNNNNNNNNNNKKKKKEEREREQEPEDDEEEEEDQEEEEDGLRCGVWREDITRSASESTNSNSDSDADSHSCALPQTMKMQMKMKMKMPQQRTDSQRYSIEYAV